VNGIAVNRLALRRQPFDIFVGIGDANKLVGTLLCNLTQGIQRHHLVMKAPADERRVMSIDSDSHEYLPALTALY